MFDAGGWRARAAAVAALIVLVAAFWIYVFQRQSAQPSNAAHEIAAGEPSGTASAVPLPSASASASALRVSIVGDTIATGRYASGPDARFRALILSALQARGPVVFLEAVPVAGSGVSTAVTVPSDLDLVVLEVGTDDTARTDVASFASTYGSLVKSVRASSPKAAVVCAGTWSAIGKAYDAVIRQDCAGGQGSYVSLRTLYDDPANRGPARVSGFYGVSDDTAPNDAGHRAIAEALLHAVGLRLT